MTHQNPLDLLIDRINEDFRYHQPTSSSIGLAHDEVRVMLHDLAVHAATNFGPSNTREMSLGLTALEEAMHWFNANIAKHQYWPKKGE